MSHYKITVVENGQYPLEWSSEAGAPEILIDLKNIVAGHAPPLCAICRRNPANGGIVADWPTCSECHNDIAELDAADWAELGIDLDA